MPNDDNGMRCGTSKWMEGTGPDGEIVLSSRIRLARNIMELPFPYLASDSQTESVNQQLEQASKKLSNELGDIDFLRMSDIPSLQRQVLVEKHLISPLLVKEPHNSAVMLRRDQAISIMINEEDHLRIQCLLPGLQLEQAFDEANRYDDLFRSEERRVGK